jgi:hypothetical protein
MGKKVEQPLAHGSLHTVESERFFIKPVFDFAHGRLPII